MPATMSIRGLAYAEETIWNEMVLPTGMTSDDRDIITDNIILECAELEILYTDPWFMRKAIGSWSKKELPTWERIYSLAQREYNPIENYDRTEETTETGSNSRTDTGSGSEAHSGTDTQAHSGKDTVQNSGSDSSQTSSTTTTTGTHTDTNSGTDTVTHNRMAFDSNTAVTTDTDSTQHGHVLTQGINDSVSESGTASVTHGQKVETTHGESIGFTHGESVTTSSSNSSTVENEITRETHMHGNIGTMTVQSMAEQEIIVSPKLNVYNYIVQSFKNRFCIEVW